MFLGQMRHEGGLDPTRQLEFCAIDSKHLDFYKSFMQSSKRVLYTMLL